ncbi:Ubiquitin-like domain superfamily [Arabidopsis suecica]|uniref:Ubiquitin-like domain superfamily n=1 Tax=Arabidopsis suecica TaxID=45249 RepID=A0A8T2E8G1_ARASU|nr:Ubiquitin-like domain superfamily [Arabidopsis suecica]
MADQSSKPLQFFVRLLDGKSLTLSFSSPLAYGEQIKQRIFEQTKIPTHLQRLISGGYQISDGSAISQPDATVNLVLSLRGGKGGFGSLLRGGGMKAGQKKTNNFDACRDMSGRRLRHVNAENRLQEWKDGEEGRNLEKKALEYLKKQSNKVKQGVGNGATQKYVSKYKEESDKCILAVDLALNESFKNGKRKAKIGAESEKKKRLKIWKGKRAVEDSDSDDSDDEEDEKSVVLNNGGQDGDSSGKSSCNSGSEEENDAVMHRSFDVVKEEITGVQGIIEEEMNDLPVSVAVDDANTVADEMDQLEKVEKSSGDAGKNLVDVACETLITSAAVKREGTAKETVSVDAVCCKPVEPLNFDDFNSPADMEVLGMGRLKTELQSRGLKCGGTLRERAARLFLLKSTPLEKLPKKLLAKK